MLHYTLRLFVVGGEYIAMANEKYHSRTQHYLLVIGKKIVRLFMLVKCQINFHSL